MEVLKEFVFKWVEKSLQRKADKLFFKSKNIKMEAKKSNRSFKRTKTARRA